MLTLDDCNTILAKYKNANWFYEIDFSNFESFPVQQDFCIITKKTSTIPGTDYYFEVQIVNDLFTGVYYLKDNTGAFKSGSSVDFDDNVAKIYVTQSVADDPDFIFGIHLCHNPPSGIVSLVSDLYDVGFYPLSSTIQPDIDGEGICKFYILPIESQRTKTYLVDGEEVSLEEDDTGYYLPLTMGEDCVLGTHVDTYGDLPLFNVVFQHFKKIPTLAISGLYKGTPQKVILGENDTYTVITDFQAYYQGRKLNNNIIDLPNDVGNTVDLVIDLHDKRYPEVRVKMKAKASIYECRNKSNIETAISKGIKSIRFDGPSESTTVTGVTFEDMRINFHQGVFKDCTFNNCTLQISGYSKCHDGGGNVFNNCRIESTYGYSLEMDAEGSVYNDCVAENMGFYKSKLLYTGTIKNCVLNKAIVISDGDIEITGSEFKGKYGADYFPNFLYLTGNYTVKGNSFTLSGTWSEPSFDMCIIKTIEGFNPSQFINDNTFDLNIVYDDEPVDTFYYNIVDDDKIYARRLS